MLYVQAGRLELVSSVEVPRAARKIRATFCPKVHITEPEYIVMGGEDTSVYIYDISKPSYGPLVVTRLQVSLYCQSLWQNSWSEQLSSQDALGSSFEKQGHHAFAAAYQLSKGILLAAMCLCGTQLNCFMGIPCAYRGSDIPLTVWGFTWAILIAQTYGSLACRATWHLLWMFPGALTKCCWPRVTVMARSSFGNEKGPVTLYSNKHTCLHTDWTYM